MWHIHVLTYIEIKEILISIYCIIVLWVYPKIMGLYHEIEIEK